MNTKISVFFISVKGIIYLLLYHLQDYICFKLFYFTKKHFSKTLQGHHFLLDGPTSIFFDMFLDIKVNFIKNTNSHVT